MPDQDHELVRTLMTSTLLGAFAGMACLAWLMFFDVSSIATLSTNAAGPSVFSAFVLGGSMAKGGLVGFVAGLAWAGMRRPAPARRPLR
jgi:hypothetical protein